MASLGSMTAASKALFITQPAISHAIGQLEDILQCRLFERVSRRLILTDEGRLLRETTQSMFDLLQSGDVQIKDLRARKIGLLRIGCPFLLLQNLLTPHLASFHHDFDHVRIQMKIENRMLPMLELLKKDEIDLLFLATPSMERLNTDFCEETIGTYKYTFFASKKHFPHLQGRSLSWEEINTNPIVILKVGNNTRDFIERKFNDRGLRLNAEWETDTMALTEEFTKAGFGIGVMIVMQTKAQKRTIPELFELKLEQPLPTGRLVVLFRKGRETLSAVANFLTQIIPSKE